MKKKQELLRFLKKPESAEDDFWTADMQTKNTELEKKYGALGIADIVAKKVAEMEKEDGT